MQRSTPQDENNIIQKDKENTSMTIEFIMTAVFGISLITGFTVEGLKKILDSKNKKYSSNALAAIISIVISLLSSIIYIITSKIEFSLVVMLEILVITFLSFLSSTIGYDKVIQTFKQLTNFKDSKEDKDKEK